MTKTKKKKPFINCDDKQINELIKASEKELLKIEEEMRKEIDKIKANG